MPLGKAWSDFVSVSNPGHRPRKISRGASVESKINGSFRVAIVKVICFLVFLGLFGSLISIQIFQGKYFQTLANGNRLRETLIRAPRGIISDRNGVPLVSNLPAFELQQCEGGEKCQMTTISKDQAIDLQSKGLKGDQTLTISTNRHYLYGQQLAHILGYVSEVNDNELKIKANKKVGDLIGRGGIEEMYDDLLSGKPGKVLSEVDAMGQKLRSLSTLPPQAGKNVQISVDLRLQKTVADLIEGIKGTAIVLDPNNGEVLALASSPNFDPNVFTDLSMDQTERAKKITSIFEDEKQPLFDRAISGTYPPGSTFKIVTSIAGLESGKIDESYSINDPGILIIGPYKFPNWKYLQGGGMQGVLNVVSAIKVSNDIFFYEVGGKLGVDGLADWAVGRFGLASKTGVDLPNESAGVFPTKSWRDQFAREWYLGDTYHLAIGQGDMLVTPLQVAMWTSVIANDGKYCTPHVLKEGTKDRGQGTGNNCRDLGISVKTLKLVKQGLVEACSPGGTAYPLFNFQVRKEKGEGRNIQVACKTGTAEFGDPNNRTHGWLTAFAPVENPEVVVTVLVEAGGEGSDVAAPIVKKILEKYFEK